MEQEFKNRILDYLVGNLTPTQPIVPEGQIQNAPSITETYSRLLNNLKGYVSDNKLIILGTIMVNNYIISYGRKGATNNGFILLMDKYLNVLQLLTTYDGGTAIPGISYLKQIEDGTFVALAQNFNSNSRNYWFLQLNNFTVTLDGEYKLKYKQQYELPSAMKTQLDTYTESFEITKKQGEATYLFTYKYTTDTPHSVRRVSMNTLKIVVGAENEWQHYISNEYILTQGDALYAEWYGNDFRVKLDYGVAEDNGDVLYEERFVNGVLTNSYVYKYKNVLKASTDDIVSTSFDDTYVSLWHYIEEGMSILYVCRINKQYYDTHDKESLIYKEEYGNTTQPLTGTSRIHLHAYNNFSIGYQQYQRQVRIYFFTNYDENNPNSPGGGAIIKEFETYEDLPASVLKFTTMENTYNLYTITFLPTLWQNLTDPFLQQIIFVYNTNNYNGLSYNDYNSMIPSMSIMYSEGNPGVGSLLFARNLYNVSINQNTTESTVEIPNTLLNDVSIYNQRLFGKTNSILNTNNQVLTKNIYETLYINFFNTINIKNANDPNNVIINIPGASRLNGSISGYNSYNNVKIGLVKVNYTDNTSQNITGLEVTKNSDTNYTISFVIYVPKEILSIQIMSNDGMTTYQTINPNLQTEKFYRITQDVKIV